MLVQRLVRALVPPIAFAALATSFPSCSRSADSGSGDAGDDRAAIDLDSALPPIDGSTCDPCVRMCPCMPGESFFNPATCANESCGSNGAWGGTSCTVGPGCPMEAGEDASFPTDAATDGGSEASTDAPSEASIEASVEAGGD